VRSTRRILLLAIGALSAASSLLGAEWIWRRAVRASHRAERAAFRLPMFAVVDGPALYGLAPGLDATQQIPDPAGGPTTAVRYRVNQDALRHHAVWPPPEPADAPRLLFVGDSYTFGTAVGDGEAFPHQVEQQLQELGVRSFAINAGVPGHNSEQELAVLRDLLVRYHPKVVVLGFVMNDAEPPTFVAPAPDDTYRGALSWLGEDGKRLGNGLCAALIDDRPLLETLRPTYEFDYRESWRPGSAKAAACMAAIVAMHAACRAHDAALLVAVLPDFTRDFDDTYPFLAIHAQVAALGAEHGFATLDTLDGLRSADAKTMRVPGDGHPTREGHRRLAAQIAPRVAEVLRG